MVNMGSKMYSVETYNIMEASKTIFKLSRKTCECQEVSICWGDGLDGHDIPVKLKLIS